MRKNRLYLITLTTCITLTLIFNTLENAWFEKSNNSEVEIKHKEEIKTVPEEDPFEKDDLIQLSGKTSTTTHNLSTLWEDVSDYSSLSSYDAKIAIDNQNNIHIVWVEDLGDDDIQYRMYNYTSKSFGPIYNVSDPTLGYNGNESITPDICVDTNLDVHITWNEFISSGNIFYRKFHATTKTWENILPVYYKTPNAQDPSITCTDSGDVAIASRYSDPLTSNRYRILVNFSTNGWSDSDSLFQGVKTTRHHRTPDIKYDSVYHLSFSNLSTSFSDYEIGYMYYTPGVGWSTYSRISQNDAYERIFPEFAIKNSRMFLAWEERYEHGATDYFHIIARNKTIAEIWDFDDHPEKDLSGNTGSSTAYQMYCTTLDLNGDILITFKNSTNGIAYKKFTSNLFDYSGYFTTGLNCEYPTIDTNNYNSIYAVWDLTTSNNLQMRKLDTYGPQLSVFNILNDTSYKGVVDLESKVFYSDIKSINYTYWIDANENGLADAGDTGSSWIIIHNWTNSESLNEFNSTWDTTNWEGTILDIPKILIRVKAIDENGLDEEIIYGGITIDNYDPQISEISEIYDEAGHSYLSGDSNFTYYDGGYIRITFNAYDNNTGSGTIVRLYSGGSLIATNTSNSQFEFTSGLADGIYNFYINVSDNIGNTNQSIIINNIRIDHTVPDLNFDNLVENEEYTNGYSISITSAATDILYINYSYYITNPAAQVYIGSDISPSGTWSFSFTSALVYEDVTFVINATDFAGLYHSEKINITIDNQVPTWELVDPITEVGVGLNSFNFSFSRDYTDNDTVLMQIYCREFSTGSYVLATNGSKTITDANRYKINTTTQYFIVFTYVFFPNIEDDWTYVDLQIRTTDNQGLINISNLLKIEILFNIPFAPKEVESDLDDYTVTITWEVIAGLHYTIYRSYTPFDIDTLNLLGPVDRGLELGIQPGDKYCIARIDQSEVTGEFEEELNGPNVYYYLVMGLEGDTPGRVSAITVTIKSEKTNKEILENQSRFWIFFFIMYLAAMLVITELSFKRIKRRFFKARVKVYTKEVEKEEYVSFEKEEKEGILDIKVPTQIKTSVPSIPSTSETEYVSFESEEKKETTIEKCPTCGWILSSTASKCPRCGWVRM